MRDWIVISAASWLILGLMFYVHLAADVLGHLMFVREYKWRRYHVACICIFFQYTLLLLGLAAFGMAIYYITRPLTTWLNKEI